MYCYNCGAQIPEGSKFCPECGTRLTPTADVNRGMHEETEYKAENYEPVRNEDTIPERSTVQDNVRKKPKRHRLLKLLIVILCIFAAFLLYDSRELYIYSTISIISHDNSASQTRGLIESQFQKTYMIHTDEEYIVFNPLSGLGLTETSLKENIGEKGQVEFTTSGNYAYIEIRDYNSTERITISYIKPTLPERIYFISKYYSW